MHESILYLYYEVYYEAFLMLKASCLLYWKFLNIFGWIHACELDFQLMWTNQIKDHLLSIRKENQTNNILLFIYKILPVLLFFDANSGKTCYSLLLLTRATGRCLLGPSRCSPSLRTLLFSCNAALWNFVRRLALLLVLATRSLQPLHFDICTLNQD